MEWINELNWRKIIDDAVVENDITYRFNEPAAFAHSSHFEEQLGIAIPEELHSLYKQTNGIEELVGEELSGHLIWPIDMVIEENLQFRSNADFKDLYMPFDNMLFFAGAGNGDLFFIPILNNNTPRLDIFVWNHEDDSRTWVAGWLHRFVTGWIRGEITV
jgi:hypothetical protein